MKKKNLIVAITGASGSPYAHALLRALPMDEIQIHLVASSAGKLVYGLEMERPLEEDLPTGVRLYDEKDFTAPFASGSFPSAGMIIVPCSMGTLAAIAGGISQNLIHRAADVCLKESRKLVIVPRETPLNRIHLTNMLRVSEAGGIILPPMPGFYHRPKTIDELVHFVVARIMEQFQIPQNLVTPWDPGGS
ncbi:UbiX family flavin prenyltransferase [Desulforhabdus amnigena]|uniref:Flavin prenyltransferase UbiX n=1 Tax=Desulforhabdus amnigena TaxID=40218 RepID=A0A9W6FVW7_9BACT|nr:UbiX family flavin prenyltransferase [Desulforhabdus amnigena]GLI35861.1 putative UbiX-like flavin prenyltransferase [Desulforhabdus amnigena]